MPFSEFIQRKTNPAIILSLSLVILAIVTQLSSLHFMKDVSSGVMKQLDEIDSIHRKISESTLADTAAKVVTLKRQYLVSEKIKGYYKNLGAAYYSNYYSFSICSILFITLLTIAVFLMANNGWQSASLILKSFLLTTIVLSSIYYFLPTVLNNKENMKNNMDKVRVYQKIQSDILSFSNHMHAPVTDPKARTRAFEMDSVIENNYNRITDNFDFLTTIDDSKLNSEMVTLLNDYKKQK